MKKPRVFLLFAVMILLFAFPVSAEQAEEPDEWTVLIYMCGSDLESKYSFGTMNLEEIAAVEEPKSVIKDVITGISILENASFNQTGKVNVLIETGGAKAWHADELDMQIRTDALQYWQYHPMTDSTESSFTLENEKPLASMARPETLTDFIRWGTENYPAKKYALVLWNHGGGSTTGIFIDELFDGEYMTLDLLKQALRNGGAHFEAVLFDACMMANIETACAIREYADWMIASEELVAGKGTAMGEWLQELFYVPKADGRLLGRWICDTAMIKYTDSDDTQSQELLTWSVINLNRIEKLEKNFDTVFEIMSAIYVDYPEILTNFTNAAHYYEAFGTGQENMYDLGGFMYAPVLRTSATADMQMILQETLAECVDYCVRGSGRPAARGISFCYATNFRKDKLDIYARNCPSPHYLAILDAISPWEAPDWVYEQADRVPELPDESIYQVKVEKTVWKNGSPAFRVTDGEYNVSSVRYTLYKFDELLEQKVNLGVVPVFYDKEAELYRVYDLTSWPSIDGNYCEIELQSIASNGSGDLLYNIPVMINTDIMNMRCAYRFAEATFEILGLWEDYDSDSSQFNRNVTSLSQVAGREYCLLYEVQNGKGGKTDYVSGPLMTMYRAIKVNEKKLPSGTYYLQFMIDDSFMRTMKLDTVEFSWDGEEIVFRTGPWEGSAVLNPYDYYSD